MVVVHGHVQEQQLHRVTRSHGDWSEGWKSTGISTKRRVRRSWEDRGIWQINVSFLKKRSVCSISGMIMCTNEGGGASPKPRCIQPLFCIKVVVIPPNFHFIIYLWTLMPTSNPCCHPLTMWSVYRAIPLISRCLLHLVDDTSRRFFFFLLSLFFLLTLHWYLFDIYIAISRIARLESRQLQLG